ncbi:MAG: outer membrane beta-barrel protein [Rhizobiaceae bacterium]|nr:outer membrane beta-barrel protein [Rhizobiaceae bacterium]
MTTSSLKLTSIAVTIALMGQVAGAMTVPENASAADMLADDTYDYTEVEFGTGWYLRGDIGAGMSEVSVEANFISGDADLGTPISIGVAAGYTFAEGLRAEVGLNHFNNLAFASRTFYADCGLEDHDGDGSPVDIPDGFGGFTATAPVPVTGTCYSSANAQVNASSLMANVYADLGTYWGIRPYVGAGLGAAYVSWNDFTISDYCDGSQSTDCGAGGGVGLNTRYQGTYTTENSWTLAANAMLGVSYELSRGLNLDVGYRYTYLGEAGVARAADNSGIFSDLTVGNTHIHEVRMGLRYEIW